MLSVPDSARIFVARDPVDFRRQFDGLAGIARDEFDMDPCSGHVFVFFNKRRDRIKILVFGSCLVYPSGIRSAGARPCCDGQHSQAGWRPPS